MHSEKNIVHALRLLPGQDLRAEIETYVRKAAIQAGWIITCVGSLTQMHLRFANQSNGLKANGHFEIVSLTGTISIAGCHLHLSVSDSDGRTSGGHLLYENWIYTTAEIIIGTSDELNFTRGPDARTGWKELRIEKNKIKRS